MRGAGSARAVAASGGEEAGIVCAVAVAMLPASGRERQSRWNGRRTLETGVIMANACVVRVAQSGPVSAEKGCPIKQM